MHLSWIVFILLSGQIQINAIQFPIVIPRIMIKIPMAFVSLIRAAPCRDNACLYDSDKVAVPFVSSPICDSWHSDVVFSQPYLLQKNRGRKKVDWFVAAGEGKQGFVRASQGLEREKNIVIPPLAVWTLFEYVHVSKKRQTAEVSPQTVF